ncbi:unnamed protein product [Cyclocybe aegerita]|uniref:Uncharacterized protein n=1 Tax=Cyclocybe aegerita TaxID=1973307 RepID=A0A8S0VXI9_CYCAE|nr:unnamed protein product [Cyclocybe aegerita]
MSPESPTGGAPTAGKPLNQPNPYFPVEIVDLCIDTVHDLLEGHLARRTLGAFSLVSHSCARRARKHLFARLELKLDELESGPAIAIARRLYEVLTCPSTGGLSSVASLVESFSISCDWETTILPELERTLSSILPLLHQPGHGIKEFAISHDAWWFDLECKFKHSLYSLIRSPHVKILHLKLLLGLPNNLLLGSHIENLVLDEVPFFIASYISEDEPPAFNLSRMKKLERLHFDICGGPIDAREAFLSIAEIFREVTANEKLKTPKLSHHIAISTEFPMASFLRLLAEPLEQNACAPLNHALSTHFSNLNEVKINLRLARAAGVGEPSKVRRESIPRVEELMRTALPFFVCENVFAPTLKINIMNECVASFNRSWTQCKVSTLDFR